jgi:hypothetical protein
MSAAASKSSKAPSKPYHMFEQTWIECEKKTKSPTTKKSAKSKKCKASKAASIVEADSDKTETVEKVVEPVMFDPPEQKLVRQHIDHVFIFSVAKINYVSHIEFEYYPPSSSESNRSSP